MTDQDKAARGHRRLWIGTALVSLVLATLLLAARSTPEGDPPVSGSPTLGIAARRGARVFPVTPGGRVRPGDQIRFVLERVKYPYSLIASVDGAGRPNIYVPYEGKESVPVTPADQVELAGRIVLDDHLGPERFFALYSRRPLPAESVRRALQALGEKGPAAIRETLALEVPADAQSSLVLEKVAE
jgi:hypothetical protein